MPLQQQQRIPSYISTLLIAIGIYTLLPFLFLHFYNHPSADDFSFAVRDREMNYLSVLLEYYMNWTGRYFSTITFFRINPMIYGSLNLYKFYSLANMFLLIINTLILFYNFFTPVLSLKRIFAFTALLISLYLLLMPSPAEGFYFFATYATYQFPNIMVLLLLAILYLLFQTDSKFYKAFYTGIGSILCIAMVGSNEMSLILAFTTCLLLLITNWNDRVHRNYLFLLLIICTISCLIAVLAPGNYARMTEHPNASRFTWSTVYAAFLTLLTFYRWFAPVLIASVIYMFLIGLPLADKKKNSHLFSLDIRLVTAYFLATIFLMYFAFAWSTGERATPRVENVICFFFIFGWFYLLQVALNRYSHLLQYERLMSQVITIVALLLYVLNILGIENNISTAYIDLLSGKAAAYDRALDRRYAELTASDCRECTVAPLPAIPKTIYFMDILEGVENNDFWVNEGFATYWNKAAVHLSEPNPPITDNLSTLRDRGKNTLREKEVIE